MVTFCKFTSLICLLTIFSRHTAFSQTRELASQESKLVKLYWNLLNHRDSADFYSEKFSAEFTALIKANAATLPYPFKKLIDSNYCLVETSSDGKFRVYSWDTWTGGTMHFFKQIYQWKYQRRVFTEVPGHDEGDAGTFCSQIYTVGIKNKIYYLVVSNRIYSTKDASQSISAFTIDEGKLIDTIKLFKTKTTRLSNIDMEFDFFSVADKPERPLELITYDDKEKIIYIPVVGGNGQVTNRNILYQLKDNCFEFIGIETGKRK
jgi:hypothetical protein